MNPTILLAFIVFLIIINCGRSLYSTLHNRRPTFNFTQEITATIQDKRSVKLSGQTPATNLSSVRYKINYKKINLLLYTRNNTNKPIYLTDSNIKEVDGTKTLKIIIHGWFVNYQRAELLTIKDAYLNRYDCNVIVVDWYYYASCELYPISVLYAMKLGKAIGKFLCSLKVPLNKIHVVGHSLGGHLSGFIGKSTKEKCGLIGRITALDPAGPFFEGNSKTERLDRSDAEFVDVIHTNHGVLGYAENIGHADFYVNCAKVQPGCTYLKLNFSSIDEDGFLQHDGKKCLSFTEAVLGQYTRHLCSHIRAVLYMTESINGGIFESYICDNCTTNCHPTFPIVTTLMGEDCPGTTRGSFALYTNSKPEFAKGPLNKKLTSGISATVSLLLRYFQFHHEKAD